MKRTLLVVASLALAACGGSSGSARSDTSAATGDVSAANAMVRGTIANISGSAVTVTTDTGTVTVQLAQPVQVFDRQPSTLANVKQSSFIGVTTVKQPDGTEQATEIHIFPDALRGLGEGSRMMTQNAATASGSRMTNGAVADAKPSTMTNGTASASRMSNGSVASTTGSALVVTYAGGSTNVVVPPNTPVTEILAVSKPLAAGDRVVVVATKGANGALTSNRVMLAAK